MSVYAFSDIHGNGILWDNIKNFLSPDDKVYFLGDAIDRGPDGFRIMKEIMADSRFVYLKGNHELLMQDALETFKSINDLDNEDMELWDYNGGFLTLMNWAKEGADFSWIDKIKKLPLTTSYTNEAGILFEMSHAGYNPGNIPTDEKQLVWDRNHIFEIPDINKVDPYTKILHGHSPAPYYHQKIKIEDPSFSNELTENILVYSTYGTKIDIDSWTFKTKSISLLNLDTYEVHIFKE